MLIAPSLDPFEYWLCASLWRYIWPNVSLGYIIKPIIARHFPCPPRSLLWQCDSCWKTNASSNQRLACNISGNCAPKEKSPLLAAVLLTSKRTEHLRWEVYLANWGVSLPCIGTGGIGDQSTFSPLLISPFPPACTCASLACEYPEVWESG